MNDNLVYQKRSPKQILKSRLVVRGATLLDDSPSALFMGSQGETAILLDFGEELVARLRICGEAAGSSDIKLFYGESVEEAERQQDVGPSWYHLPRDFFELAPGPFDLRSIGRRGFRYLCIRVRGGDTAVTNLEVTQENAPLRHIGHFSCSDSRLNAIWDMCARTVGLCMQNFYEDGVKRDGLLWLGDFRLEFLTGWHAFGDDVLSRKSLLMMAKSQAENGAIPSCASRGGGHQHPDSIEYMPGVPHGAVSHWILLNYDCDFVGSLREYILFTGDRGILDEIYMPLQKVVSFLWGLVDFEKPGEFWTDTAPSGTHRPKTGELYYDTLTDGRGTKVPDDISRGGFLWHLARCFLEAEQIALWRGDQPYAEQMRNQYLRLAEHLERHYYDSRQKLYFDTFGNPASVSVHPAVYHSRARSFLGEPVRKADRDLILEFLRTHPKSGMTFSYAWALDNLYAAGLVGDALEITRTAWGYMLDAGFSTTWEGMSDSWEPGTIGSACHGWTSGPAWLLPCNVVGIKPLKPGYAEAEVRPNLAFLDYAEATVPTPHGPLFARAEKDGGVLTVTVSVPPGIDRCTVALPGQEQVFSPGIGTLSAKLP
jgi:hypothetical protein